MKAKRIFEKEVEINVKAYMALSLLLVVVLSVYFLYYGTMANSIADMKVLDCNREKNVLIGQLNGEVNKAFNNGYQIGSTDAIGNLTMNIGNTYDNCNDMEANINGTKILLFKNVNPRCNKQ